MRGRDKDPDFGDSMFSVPRVTGFVFTRKFLRRKLWLVG